MKNIKYFIFLLLFAFGISSCSHETTSLSKAQVKNLKNFQKPKWKGFRKKIRKDGSLYHPAVPKSTRKIKK